MTGDGGPRRASHVARPDPATLPTIEIVVEGAMKRDWRIRRALLATADGQRRWDRAYQDLLTWASPDAVGLRPGAGEDAGKERDDGRGDLRARVDAAAGAGAND
jgi:hypothetical protein